MLCQHALLAPRAPTARRAAAARRARLAPRAVELDGDTVTAAAAIVLGLGFGIGIPVLFAKSEQRDKERIEAIRELNRATLKATGETMSEEDIAALRPNRYLDRREFVDDD